MSAIAESTTGDAYHRLLHRALLFLAVLVVARFVLELAGTPGAVTRYLSTPLVCFSRLYTSPL